MALNALPSLLPECPLASEFSRLHGPSPSLPPSGSRVYPSPGTRKILPYTVINLFILSGAPTSGQDPLPIRGHPAESLVEADGGAGGHRS